MMIITIDIRTQYYSQLLYSYSNINLHFNRLMVKECMLYEYSNSYLRDSASFPLNVRELFPERSRDCR